MKILILFQNIDIKKFYKLKMDNEVELKIDIDLLEKI
jgi:hypothetical protein